MRGLRARRARPRAAMCRRQAGQVPLGFGCPCSNASLTHSLLTSAGFPRYAPSACLRTADMRTAGRVRAGTGACGEIRHGSAAYVGAGRCRWRLWRLGSGATADPWLEPSRRRPEALGYLPFFDGPPRRQRPRQSRSSETSAGSERDYHAYAGEPRPRAARRIARQSRRRRRTFSRRRARRRSRGNGHRPDPTGRRHACCAAQTASPTQTAPPNSDRAATRTAAPTQATAAVTATSSAN